MANEKHDPWALLRQAQGWIGYWPLNKPEAGAEALKKRIDAALAAHESQERVAVFAVGNSTRNACMRCNVEGVDTRVVIDTCPPVHLVKCPVCGDRWSRT